MTEQPNNSGRIEDDSTQPQSEGAWNQFDDLGQQIWDAAFTVHPDLTDEERTIQTNKGPEVLPPKVWAARAAFRRREERIREKYQLDPWVQCVYCEDTGRIKPREDWEDQNGSDNDPCLCHLGEAKAYQDHRSALWRKAVPARYRDWTLDTCPNLKLRAVIREWIGRNPFVDGHGLVLIGDVGRGKTGAAIGALRHYHDLGRTVMFANTEDLLTTTKDGFEDKDERVPYQQRPMIRARAVELLVLDDLGAERVTDWTSQAIDSLIRTRYDERMPTIVTSNLSSDEFRHKVGPRLVSRFSESATAIPAGGVDFRKPASTAS